MRIFVQLNLTGVYGNYDLKKIQISDWDTHPNVFGHILIADKLYIEFEKKKEDIMKKAKK